MNTKKNKHKKQAGFFLLWVILLTIGLYAGDIPLQKAVEKGIQMDANYKNRGVDAQKSVLELEKAGNQRWFNMDFGGSYLFKSEQMEISFIPGKTITAGAKHNYDLKVGVLQPIFSGHMITNTMRLEEQKAGLITFQLASRELEVAGMVKSSYFTYGLLAAKKKSLFILIENLKLHLDRVTSLYEEEQVKKSDVLETELRITEAALNLEELERQMEEEDIRFTRLCSYSINDIEVNYQEDIGTLEESLARFNAAHPSLKIFDQNIDIMETGKKIMTGNYLPRLNGFAELHYGKPGLDFFKNQWSFYFQGGINVSVKLFDWHKLKRDKQLADMSIQQVVNQKAEVILEVTQKLKQLYARLRSLEKQMHTTVKLAAIAAEDAGLKEALYKENQSSNLDYLTALLNRERYESQQNELKFQYQWVKMNINTLIANNPYSATDKAAKEEK